MSQSKVTKAEPVGYEPNRDPFGTTYRCMNCDDRVRTDAAIGRWVHVGTGKIRCQLASPASEAAAT